MTFDINKEKEKALFAIEKKGIKTSQKMAVVLNLDVSGSARPFYKLHDTGTSQIQELVEGVVPLALNFDDNGSLQVFTFASGNDYVTEISPECTAENFQGYIQKNIIDNPKVNLWGATTYTEVIKENLVNLGYITTKKKLFGGTTTSLNPRNDSGYPSFVITFTDGANSDQRNIKEFLKECQDAKVNAYFLFIGVGPKNEFRNIVTLGDLYDNVGFVSAENIDDFLHNGDVYDKLLPDELVEWLKKS